MWVPLDERFPRPLREDARWQRFVWPQPQPDDIAHWRRTEHAHGCFAYVAAGAEAVAVLAAEPAAWCEAGAARYGDRFAGVFADVPALLAATGAATWVVVDGLGRYPASALALLAAAGRPVVGYAPNARTMEIFAGVLDGNGAFPPGRALGRAEYLAEIAAAGYRVTGVDRAFSRCHIPHELPPGRSVTVGDFRFERIAPEEVYDFLTDAFVFTLAAALSAAS
jgi:hypothetical protein